MKIKLLKKGRHFLEEKYRATPSVTAPSDTDVSDATVTSGFIECSDVW